MTKLKLESVVIRSYSLSQPVQFVITTDQGKELIFTEEDARRITYYFLSYFSRSMCK